MKAKKSLGQNFLINQDIILEISKRIKAQENDLIIEIGPGRGALTAELKKKNSFLLCYEIDRDLKIYLNPLEDSKTKIIYNDILKSNIIDDIKELKYNNLYIIGNLPYYITTPIIKFLIELNLPISEMIFMVQDEVANRFTALPGHKNYGSITLYLQYFYQIEKLFKVSKTAFKPVPKVESAIIRFTERKNKPIIDTSKYFKLLADSFKMKRKTLKNNLNNYNFAKISEVLKKYKLNDNVRAEELSEEIFIEITKIM